MLSSLKESRFVFQLIVVSELDLALESGKLTGLIKGDRVGAVQDVITGLGYNIQYINAIEFEQN